MPFPVIFPYIIMILVLTLLFYIRSSIDITLLI